MRPKRESEGSAAEQTANLASAAARGAAVGAAGQRVEEIRSNALECFGKMRNILLRCFRVWTVDMKR